VATEVDTRLLKRLRTPNLEIRQHDIVKEALEVGTYDLVHCRRVLLELQEPEAALSRMAEAVRPGGWLLIEEADSGSMLSTDLTNPAAAPFVEAFRGGIAVLRKMRILDPFMGRKVRELIESLGLVDVSLDGWTSISRGGDPMAEFDATIVQMAAKPLIGVGQLTEEQFSNVLRLLQDPTFYYLGFTMFAAWGRKPE
jgi:SAM-dependent methyltransferase